MSIYNNITELIGQHWLLNLTTSKPEGAADVYIKLEVYLILTSVKDRVALSIDWKKLNKMVLETWSLLKQQVKHWYWTFMGRCC